MLTTIRTLIFNGLMLISISASAQSLDYSTLNIEQLMATPVNTVTRSEYNLADSAAATFIISRDDIQRSGTHYLPDLLRMVPGVQVAQISTNQWAVSARGFNGRYANKMLVLIDGRAIYSPTFAGVRWENHGLVMDDIERIEVIRGSGASVWGQNAVNGVINIITRHANHTQKELLTVTSGNEDQGILELRYGDHLSPQAPYRVYGKFIHRDGLVDLDKHDNDTDWTQGRGGARLDWQTERDRMQLHLDGYWGSARKAFLLPTLNQNPQPSYSAEQNAGMSLLSHWEHDFSIASRLKTQLYYDYFQEDDNLFGSENRHTFDLDVQHDYAWSDYQLLNWGLAYRYVSDTVHQGKLVYVNPEQQNLHLFSAFIQDEIRLFDDQLRLILGTKIQYYTLTDWDYQPSARLLWKLHPKHRLWLAFARATRSPSRGETALSLKPLNIVENLPLQFSFQSNAHLQEERMFSYELGYRTWLANDFSIDLSVFYNDYDHLITGLRKPFNLLNPLLSFTFANGAKAQTWGIEITTDWRITEWMRWQTSYNLLQVNNQNFNFSNQKKPRTDPTHQLSFRASIDLSQDIYFDLGLRYVDQIAALNTLFSPARKVDSYVGIDLRLAWQAAHDMQLSIGTQNINQAQHQEFVEEVFAYPQQLQRSVYAKLQWYF